MIINTVIVVARQISGTEVARNLKRNVLFLVHVTLTVPHLASSLFLSRSP